MDKTNNMGGFDIKERDGSVIRISEEAWNNATIFNIKNDRLRIIWFMEYYTLYIKKEFTTKQWCRFQDLKDKLKRFKNPLDNIPGI